MAEINPKISIIVPCYNQEDYINECLQSVKRQTFEDWECIVVDDGSTDNSQQFILDWTKRDIRFRSIYKENGGIAESRNMGIREAKGEFILTLDGDDMLHDSYIEKALGVFDSKPKTKLVYCDPILFGVENRVIKSNPYQYETFLLDNTIPCTGVYRKSDFEETNGYQSNMKYGLEDWDFWVSLLNKNDIVVKLDVPAIFYRIKNVSRSTELKTNADRNEMMLKQMFLNNSKKYLDFLNPIRNKIQADYYMKENETLKNSFLYKLGKMFCFPFMVCSKIRKRFWK